MRGEQWGKLFDVPFLIPQKWGRSSPKWEKIDERREFLVSFVGSYPHSLDSKKRVFIPAKYREELGGEFYITRKFDPYLSIYTAKDWEEYVARLSALPEAEAYPLQEYILGSAQKCTPDSNGRIILDEKLMKHASINKNVVFVGSGQQIKIWAEEVWAAREGGRNLDQIKELMLKYGL